jgi:5-methylcytosine-specific restriction protein A
MKSPCKYPGCRELVDRIGWCANHQSSATDRHKDYDRGRRQIDPALSLAANIRSGWKWKKVRRQKLTGWPLCQDPFKDHERRNATETAKQVHHIVGLATHPELAYTLDNLMSVCTRCHARLERLDTQQGNGDSNAPQATIGGKNQSPPLFG